MHPKASKAATAVRDIKARRFSYAAICRWLEGERGIITSPSHLCRIANDGREASGDLEKGLIAARKAMK